MFHICSPHVVFVNSVMNPKIENSKKHMEKEKKSKLLREHQCFYATQLV